MDYKIYKPNAHAIGDFKHSVYVMKEKLKANKFIPFEQTTMLFEEEHGSGYAAVLSMFNYRISNVRRNELLGNIELKVHFCSYTIVDGQPVLLERSQQHTKAIESQNKSLQMPTLTTLWVWVKLGLLAFKKQHKNLQ